MDATKPPDADLVARARNDDRAAFDALVNRYRPLVEWLARRLLNDREAAEDCVQTTFIRAWERLFQLREASRFASWLQTICRSVAANMRASESLRHDREAAVDYGPGAPDLLDRLLTRLWIRKAVELEHHLLRHLQEKDMPVKRLIPGANGETTFFIDHHFVAVFEWFGGTDPEWEQLDTQEALGDLCGQLGWGRNGLRSSRRTLARAGLDLAPPQRLGSGAPLLRSAAGAGTDGVVQAVRALKNPPSYHNELLRGVDDTEERLQRFEKQVNTLGLKELPPCINNGVMMGVIQEFDLTIAHVDDYVHEPRIGSLGRLLDLAAYQSTFPDAPGHDRARQVLDAFQKHISLTDAELRALPWIALSFGLFYRVFHVLMYMGEVEDNPEGEGARYFAAQIQEELIQLTQQEEDIERLTEVFLNS